MGTLQSHYSCYPKDLLMQNPVSQSFFVLKLFFQKSVSSILLCKRFEAKSYRLLVTGRLIGIVSRAAYASWDCEAL